MRARRRAWRHQHDEAGSIVLWVLGVCMMVFFVGGVSLDLWRAATTQRSVSSAVDAAALAGASGLDEASFRAGDVVRLEPGRAEELAAENLAAQPHGDDLVDVGIEATPERITVRAGRQMDFTLLKVFLVGQEPVVLRATSSVDPRRQG